MPKPPKSSRKVWWNSTCSIPAAQTEAGQAVPHPRARGGGAPAGSGPVDHHRNLHPAGLMFEFPEVSCQFGAAMRASPVLRHLVIADLVPVAHDERLLAP